MFEQLPPFSSHRSHWYRYVIGSVPVHVPLFAVSVEPTFAVPEMVGGDVLCGAAAGAAEPTPTMTPSVVTAAAMITRPAAMRLRSLRFRM
jgi:hypothetical protein